MRRGPADPLVRSRQTEKVRRGKLLRPNSAWVREGQETEPGLEFPPRSLLPKLCEMVRPQPRLAIGSILQGHPSGVTSKCPCGPAQQVLARAGMSGSGASFTRTPLAPSLVWMEHCSLPLSNTELVTKGERVPLVPVLALRVCAACWLGGLARKTRSPVSFSPLITHLTSHFPRHRGQLQSLFLSLSPSLLHTHTSK